MTKKPMDVDAAKSTEQRGRGASRLVRGRHRDEEGMSLVELMVSMVVLLVIMGMTMIVLNTFYANQNQLSASYSAFQQVLPASTSLQQFFRTLTEAAPTNASTGVPVPAFTPVSTSPASALTGPFNISPNSAIFTTNLGNPSGPSLITATTTANTSPVGTYTLTVTVAAPNGNTCPGLPATGNNLSATSSACTWGTPTRAFQINDITNGSPTATSPIFQYTLSTGSAAVPYTTGTNSPGSVWLSNFGASSCSSVSACPITGVQTVTMDIEVQAPGGQSASYKTTVSALAPFYSKFVG